MVAGFWTLDLTTITGQSAFILRHHTAAVSSYDCTFDDLELVHQSLRTLEPPHTHKFPRVNAQDSKLGPIQPWDVKDFLTLTVSDSPAQELAEHMLFSRRPPAIREESRLPLEHRPLDKGR